MPLTSGGAPAAETRADEGRPERLAQALETRAGQRLLERARRGEIAAFRDILRRHQDRVYTLALRLVRGREDAEELAQDVFVSLHRHLADIVSEEHLRFWLRRTVCHRAIDRLRRRPSAPALPLASAAEIEGPAAGTDPILERRLRALVGQLPPMARAAILLRYQEDLDPPEIARTLGVPLNTVKSHLKRSLALLRGRCEELRDRGDAGEPL